MMEGAGEKGLILIDEFQSIVKIVMNLWKN